MKPLIISTKNKRRGVNLAVDLKNKEICLVKGLGPDAVFLGVVRDGAMRNASKSQAPAAMPSA